MTSELKLLNGSYKGVPFALQSGTLDGGRKTSVKQFPGRDTQNVEDLGQKPRKYALEIVLSDKVNEDYFSYRKKLLAALESKGTGDLIHPLYGRISDVVAVSFSLNENLTSFGDSTVMVSFEVANNRGIPQASANVITQIAASNTIVQQAVEANVAEEFIVTPSNTGNFAAAVDKVTAVIDTVRSSTSFIGEAAQDLNNFNATLGALADDVNGLVSDPLALSRAISGMFSSVNGLYQSAESTLETVLGFFGFGDGDSFITTSTSIKSERRKNNDVLNSAIGGASLGYSYLAAVGVDYETTRDIDTVVERLDEQYTAVMTGEASQDVKDSLIDMRLKVLDSLDALRVNTSQIITISTPPTTVRMLAFNYYGSDDNGQTIAELNNISDVSFIEGELEILTT